MKTQTILIYEHADLVKPENREVLENVLSWIRENWIDAEPMPEPYFNEACEALTEFCKLFGSEVRYFSLDTHRNDIEFTYPGNSEGLTGLRLRTWIINNILDDLEGGKYYHYKGAHRHSKCQYEINCPFTGTCYDMSLLYPLIEFCKNPDDRDLQDLFTDCVFSLVKDLQSEQEYRYSETAILEDIEANQYEFLESGEPA